jgi:hypothetical protein
LESVRWLREAAVNEQLLLIDPICKGDHLQG